MWEEHGNGPPRPSFSVTRRSGILNGGRGTFGKNTSRPMTWMHPYLLYGLGLAVIPVILHFLLRPRPKRLVFPALELVRRLRKQNVRRLRLRHIWLLLLRILFVVLLVLALARPSLPAADYGLTWRESLTLLAIVVVCLAAYAAVLRWWRRHRVPQHVLNSRRTYLRGGVGVCGLLLAALLVGWPYQRRIAAEWSAPLPPVAEDVPVAAVFVFDTSLSMAYQVEGRSRLDVAQEIAIEHLEALPLRSRIGIAETSHANPIVFQDPADARHRIESLQIGAVALPLNQRLRAALSVLEEDRRERLESAAGESGDAGDPFLREIYVFTDLARSAWKTQGSDLLRSELARLPWASLYLIDVGIESPQNVGITELQLSDTSIAPGNELMVEATVSCVGPERVERTVELYVQDASGKAIKQGQRMVGVEPQGAARVRFPVKGLAGPVSQGEVRLVGSDPLQTDDARYFTVQVRPPPRVLIVAPSRREADFWMTALAPPGLVEQKRARYECHYLRSDRLAGLDADRLAQFAAVCLINVPAVAPEVWERLEAFVQAGGGVAVFAGSEGVTPGRQGVDPVSYNSPEAVRLLPAQLLAHLRFDPPEFLDLERLEHPILQLFDRYGQSGELPYMDIRRYWKVQPHGDAHVILRFTDPRHSPALLERVVGKGRCSLMTTGVDLVEAWNDLPRAGWAFIALADQTMRHLTRSAETTLNYTAGEDVVLPLDRSLGLKSYLLRKPPPAFEQLRGQVAAEATALVVDHTRADTVGHYEVVAQEPQTGFLTGFSVNPPARESDFTRLDEAALDDLFGPKRYDVARNIEELARGVREGRLGREVVPYALLLVLLVLVGEHFVANHFYDADQRPDDQRAAA